MKKPILSFLAVICGGIVSSAGAAESTTASPAERNAALFASGATVQVSPVYYYGGVRYYNRGATGYRTQKVVYYRNGVRYVRYNRIVVYRYW